jgi:hypothetical protein
VAAAAAAMQAAGASVECGRNGQGRGWWWGPWGAVSVGCQGGVRGCLLEGSLQCCRSTHQSAQLHTLREPLGVRHLLVHACVYARRVRLLADMTRHHTLK